MHSRIAAALRQLSRERRTGVIKTESSRGGATLAERSITLDKGSIVSAQSSAIDERLGELMVRRGRITLSQLSDAGKLVRSGRRLGDALVELHIVERYEVESFVRTQLAEITSKVLTEPTKRLEFRDRPSVTSVTQTPVPIADAIIEAARAGRSLSQNDAPAELVAKTPMLSAAAGAIISSLNLQTEEAFVLSRCDGYSDVGEIVAQCPLPESDTARILIGLEQAGIIEMKGSVRSGH